MGLQEESGKILLMSLKAIGFVLVITYKWLLVPIIIPAIQHGIKHGWIFVPLGIIGAGFIHIILHSLFYNVSTAVAHVLSLPLYPLGIYGGVRLMRWKREQYERVISIYISPDLPEELYEDDYV